MKSSGFRAQKITPSYKIPEMINIFGRVVGVQRMLRGDVAGAFEMTKICAHVLIEYPGLCRAPTG